MSNLCVINGGKCPRCQEKLEQVQGKCKNCSANIRLINADRVKNKNFLRTIIKYDKAGVMVGSYKNVYECYPIDTKKEYKKRKRVIEVCEGKSRVFGGFQWRFSDDSENVISVDHGGAAKEIVQVDFQGKIIEEFNTVGEIKKKFGYTYTTISKACKKHVPPQGADFFLFYKKEYCTQVVREAYSKYSENKTKIEVRNINNQEVAEYFSYAESAKALGVSATSIKNWCDGKYKPTGKYEGYVFTANNSYNKKNKN